jgi:hypothetical protein
LIEIALKYVFRLRTSDFGLRTPDFGLRTQVIGFLMALLIFFAGVSASGQDKTPKFRVLAFYAAETEEAHSSFAHEANRWFTQLSLKDGFEYDSTCDWNKLNPEILESYQVIIFLDSRPDSLPQREAFRNFMEHGGAWMGFHFAGFALTPSDFPQDWDWYHVNFLGSGQYKSNTWRPTSAVLRTEVRDHPATRRLPEKFTAAPNEWYRWEFDLRNNPDIDILVSIDSSSFPLGTGPKLHEIWHSGYYPVVWTNRKYKMLYLNMGHNDIDFDQKPGKVISHSFGNKMQDRLIEDGLLWLGSNSGKNK